MPGPDWTDEEKSLLLSCRLAKPPIGFHEIQRDLLPNRGLAAIRAQYYRLSTEGGGGGRKRDSQSFQSIRRGRPKRARLCSEAFDGETNTDTDDDSEEEENDGDGDYDSDTETDSDDETESESDAGDIDANGNTQLLKPHASYAPNLAVIVPKPRRDSRDHVPSKSMRAKKPKLVNTANQTNTPASNPPQTRIPLRMLTPMSSTSGRTGIDTSSAFSNPLVPPPRRPPGPVIWTDNMNGSGVPSSGIRAPIGLMGQNSPFIPHGLPSCTMIRRDSLPQDPVIHPDAGPHRVEIVTSLERSILKQDSASPKLLSVMESFAQPREVSNQAGSPQRPRPPEHPNSYAGEPRPPHLNVQGAPIAKQPNPNMSAHDVREALGQIHVNTITEYFRIQNHIMVLRGQVAAAEHRAGFLDHHIQRIGQLRQRSEKPENFTPWNLAELYGLLGPAGPIQPGMPSSAPHNIRHSPVSVFYPGYGLGRLE